MDGGHARVTKRGRVTVRVVGEDDARPLRLHRLLTKVEARERGWVQLI